MAGWFEKLRNGFDEGHAHYGQGTPSGEAARRRIAAREAIQLPTRKDLERLEQKLDRLLAKLDMT